MPLDSPAWVWKGTVPSLNGLRALAILSVIASHYYIQHESATVIGHFGVTCFFVISGFLITLLLLRERQRTNTVSLTHFYKRRALRILPAYGAYLLIMFGLDRLGVFHLSALTWVTVLTYTSCFATLLINFRMAHTWSLSVEEHFYFLWPLLFRWVRQRTAIIWLCVIIVSSPILRYLLCQLPISPLNIDYYSPSQMSSIAIGCLMAYVVTGNFMPVWRNRAERNPFLFLSSLAYSFILLFTGTIPVTQNASPHLNGLDAIIGFQFDHARYYLRQAGKRSASIIELRAHERDRHIILQLISLAAGHHHGTSSRYPGRHSFFAFAPDGCRLRFLFSY